MATQNVFVHHVYFWLDNPNNEQHKKDLIAGLQKLSAVKTIQFHHIGVPAATKRDVIDTSYDVSWLIFFDNKEDQDSYQSDPDHLQFVADCKHLWKEVKVYDSINA